MKLVVSLFSQDTVLIPNPKTFLHCFPSLACAKYISQQNSGSPTFPEIFLQVLPPLWLFFLVEILVFYLLPQYLLTSYYVSIRRSFILSIEKIAAFKAIYAFQWKLPLEYKNNPVSLLTTHCLTRVVWMINFYSNPKSEESRDESGRELKMGRSSVLSKNSCGKEDCKFIWLSLNGPANTELDYSHFRIKIRVL